MMNKVNAVSLTGTVLVIAASFLWGTGGIASKVVLVGETISPVTVGFFRLACAGPLLLLVEAFRGGVAWRALANRRILISLIALGACQAAYQGLYFSAVQAVGVALATLVALCSSPVLILALATVFLKERVGFLAWCAVPLAVLGTALLGGAGSEVLTGSRLDGVLLALAASLSYAVFALVSRSVAGRLSAGKIVGWSFSFGAVFLLPLALAAGIPLERTLSAWGVTLYLGVVPTALAYTLFFLGMKTVSASVSGILVVVEPLTATVLAVLLFGEALSSAALVGGVLLLAAVILTAWPRRTSQAKAASSMMS